MNSLVDLDRLADLIADRVLAKLASPASAIVDLRTLPEALRRKAYAAARAGELQATKMGKRWFCRQADLDRWLLASPPSNSDMGRVERWMT